MGNRYYIYPFLFFSFSFSFSFLISFSFSPFIKIGAHFIASFCRIVFFGDSDGVSIMQRHSGELFMLFFILFLFFFSHYHSRLSLPASEIGWLSFFFGKGAPFFQGRGGGFPLAFVFLFFFFFYFFFFCVYYLFWLFLSGVEGIPCMRDGGLFFSD